MGSGKPVIGVLSNTKVIDGKPSQEVGEKYINALMETTNCLPLVIPSSLKNNDEYIDNVINRLDGLYLTGSKSNIYPKSYGQEPKENDKPFDQLRDSVAFSLINKAIKKTVPIFGLCRGIQEMNVALGGTLHTHLHEVEGKLDHRQPKSDNLDVQYGPSHAIKILSGGKLEKILNQSEVEVSSLHGQGINKLSEKLEAEAWATDGTIEAVSLKNSDTFVLGVQWHPEYKPSKNEISLKLFSAFDLAIKKYFDSKQ